MCSLLISVVTAIAAAWCPCTQLLVQQQWCGAATVATTQTPGMGCHFGAPIELGPRVDVPFAHSSYITAQKYQKLQP